MILLMIISVNNVGIEKYVKFGIGTDYPKLKYKTFDQACLWLILKLNTMLHQKETPQNNIVKKMLARPQESEAIENVCT